MKALLVKLAALLTDKKFWKKAGTLICAVAMVIILMIMTPLLLIASMADSLGYTMEQFFSVFLDVPLGLMRCSELADTMQQVRAQMLRDDRTPVQVQLGVGICPRMEAYIYAYGDRFAPGLSGCFTDPDQTMAELHEALLDTFHADIPVTTLEELRTHFYDPEIYIDRLADPETKNNLDLAAWAAMAYRGNWGCVKSTCGQVLTSSVYLDLLEQYPEDVLPPESDIAKLLINRRVCDAAGLIQGYLLLDSEAEDILWEDAEVMDIPDLLEMITGAAPTEPAEETEPAEPAPTEAPTEPEPTAPEEPGDTEEPEPLENTGEIDTLPELPGVLVWKEDLIGIYMGAGVVIYADGSLPGIHRAALEDGGWTNWGMLPSLEYREPEPEPTDPEETEPTAPTEAFSPTEIG